MRQGHNNGPTTYVVRKFYIDNIDDVQHFDLHSQKNKDIAVTERVCQSNITEVYEPDYADMEEVIDNLVYRIKDKMPPFEEIFNLDAMEEYIRTRNYTNKQKEQICAVRKDLELLNWLDLLRENWQELYFDDDGILHMKGLLNPIARKARFRAFIKDESYNKISRPRNITGASDVDKFLLGVVFGAFNHAFFSLPETIKLTPYDDRPRVISERLGNSMYVYVLDHTAFESAATADIQASCEQRLYTQIYPEFAEYCKKYALPLIFACGRDDPSIYCVDTSRASGAPNTSLGNSINNYVFINIMQKHFGANFKYLIEGDDCVINSDTELDMEEAKQFALKNGFDIKIDQVDHYCKSGFLSMQWNCDDYVVDSTEHWKHIVDAVTFRPSQVYANGTLCQKAYWKISTSKLLSLSLLNPKHELFYWMFVGSYYFHKHYNGLKQVKIHDRKHKNITFNDNSVGDKLLDKVYAHCCPHLFPEIRNIIGYDTRVLEDIKNDLLSLNEYRYEHAINNIINLYHVRENIYYKTPEFLKPGQF